MAYIDTLLAENLLYPEPQERKGWTIHINIRIGPKETRKILSSLMKQRLK